MVDADCVVRVGIERTRLVFPVVLADQLRRVAEVRQWEESLLDSPGDRVEARGGDAIAGKRRVVVQRIADHGPWKKSGKISLAPGLRCDGRVQQILRGRASRRLERVEEEGSVAAVVEAGQADGAAGRRTRNVPDAGGSRRRERVAGAEQRRRVVVEDVAVE